MKKKDKAFISHGASAILQIGLPVVLLQLIAITAVLIFGKHENGIYAFRLYCGMIEYILLDIALLTGGALLFYITERNFADRS